MKKLLFLTCIIIGGCNAGNIIEHESLALAGDWILKIDSLDMGRQEEWFLHAEGETITLPGSMAENSKGDDVSLKTPWTGDIIDKSYFTDEKYAIYREAGNIKIPFWLKPVKYYKGAAWYLKEFEQPEGWSGKIVTLFLERPHWETEVYINGKKAGSRNSLAVPHRYEISELLKEGKNIISIRVDNRMILPIGVNSHSVSDHTQSNWNGIAGDISLRASSKTFLENVAIYPDVNGNNADLVISLSNKTGKQFSGTVTIQAESTDPGSRESFKKVKLKASALNDTLVMKVNYTMGPRVQKWSEYNPAVYRMVISLSDEEGRVVDRVREDFGMREFAASGTRFNVNGQPVFLRGTTECCIFPLTGYPPSDTASWMRIFRICREYGLNHMRFHSYCPPEAAFVAADRLGVYLHVECSSWANQGSYIGGNGPIDTFIYDEGDRILAEYGNHPSFCMLAYGNEPAGREHRKYLGELLEYWKEKDSRRVYTSAAGWPVIPENEFHLVSDPRIQHWGEGLKSIINAEPPQTVFDFSDYVGKFNVPVIGHETGQWCVYPDFSEIEKYTGPLKATNFEIFRETLSGKQMGDQAECFLMASGKLQAICYKAEIEAALRTPGYAGFQILQLHDFPGQGTALVGILNPFFESKGYITPSEFREFCNETVPLARIPKLILRGNEEFSADIEIYHFGKDTKKNAQIRCVITDSQGERLLNRTFTLPELSRGNCIPAGSISFKPAGITKAGKYQLEVSVENTSYRNKWDFWVYPEENVMNKGEVHVTDKIDRATQEIMNRGGSVLLLNYGRVREGKGAEVAIGFSSIFWNTAWTNNQPPHTLGILCDPGHPLFRNFPTEYHSNWQWWDPVTHSQAMIIDDLPGEIRPLVQVVDTWFENRRLALAFEAKCNGGKLLVCSIDLEDVPESRPVSACFLGSVLDYMNSSNFNPQTEVTLSSLMGLTDN
jgi:hypothetical protein